MCLLEKVQINVHRKGGHTNIDTASQVNYLQNVKTGMVLIWMCKLF